MITSIPHGGTSKENLKKKTHQISKTNNYNWIIVFYSIYNAYNFIFFLCSVQHAHQYRFIVSFLLFVVTLKKHFSVKTVSMGGRLSGLNLFRTEIAVKFQQMWFFFQYKFLKPP